MIDTTPVTRSQAETIAREVMMKEMKDMIFQYEANKIELTQLKTGARVMLPVNEEHAKMMLIVAMNYLGIKPGEPLTLTKATDGQ